MTTLVDFPGAGPHTHALVIGVGSYAHLPDGSGKPLADAWGLRQLSSPPVSAVAFARWLLQDLNNPVAPLGSVELLTSPPKQIPVGDQLLMTEPARMANINEAFGRWYERSNSHKGNVAIFYFCGHGIVKANLALLAEDFGSNPFVLFENAIDFELTHRGMADCQAQTQLFIADSCRQVPKQVLDQLAFHPVPLKDPKVTGGNPSDAPRMYATGMDAAAWGRPEQPSLFTQALLETLAGKGSRRESQNTWVIRTGSLYQTNQVLLRSKGQPPESPQECVVGGELSGNSMLHQLRSAPMVPVTIGCDPEDAISEADLTLAGKKQYRRAPADRNWTLDVEADKYQVDATFKSRAYRDCTDEIWAQPPDGDETHLKVAW